MRIRLTGFAVFLLFVLVTVPAYANVTSLSLEKSFYTENEKFAFIGNQEYKDQVYVIIRDGTGDYKGMLSDVNPDQGKFSVIPRDVSMFFKNQGIYNATAFTNNQTENNGITIQLEFDGTKLFEVPDAVLQLNNISDKTVDVEKTVTFTASITDSSIDGAVFSLSGAAPTGATIDPDSGKFVWTPSKSQGNIQDVHYTFDVIVNQGSQEDREKITITVKQAYVEPVKEPKPTIQPEILPEPEELGLASFVDESKDPQSYVDRYNTEDSYKKWFDDNYPEYSSIYEAVGLEEPKALAPFVDPKLDPQYYVDRYNNEITYKDWFDNTYPDMTIYEAVGLEEPKALAPFVDPKLDPQSYVDRYNTEDSYKKWFDDNYPEYSSIYEAVGLEEPVMKEPEFGECGEGTELVNGECTVAPNSEEGGGCLIATATFGSEMAPQVQLLREIRDNQLMNTESGMLFMTGFNQLYYLFSPTVSDLEREYPAFKEAVKVGLTPLLSSLSIMQHAESDSEVLWYGIGVILLNIGMYFAAPAMLFYGIRKTRLVRF